MPKAAVIKFQSTPPMGGDLYYFAQKLDKLEKMSRRSARRKNSRMIEEIKT